MKKMTSPYEHDQAERLREKMIDEIKERTGTYPSRSEVHKKRRKKKKENELSAFAYSRLSFYISASRCFIFNFLFGTKSIKPQRGKSFRF